MLPESVTLDLQIAGLGSRFLSGSLDLILTYIVLVALVLLVRFVAPDSAGFGFAAIIVVFFCTFFGYGVLFDTLGQGRSPGKRVAGTRVVRRSDGGAVRVRAAAIRSIVRLIDQGTIGIIAVLVTPLHQRLGDIAAGTIVIVEPTQQKSARSARARRKAAARAAKFPGWGQASAGRVVGSNADVTEKPWSSWDVTAVSPQDLTAIRAFMARRSELAPALRQRLAHDFAARLYDKVAGVDQPPDAERFLEWVLEAKQRRSAG